MPMDLVCTYAERDREQLAGILGSAIALRLFLFMVPTLVMSMSIIVLVIGIAIFVTGSRRSSTTVENVQSTPTGQERVEERRDWGSS